MFPCSHVPRSAVGRPVSQWPAPVIWAARRFDAGGAYERDGACRRGQRPRGVTPWHVHGAVMALVPSEGGNPRLQAHLFVEIPVMSTRIPTKMISGAFVNPQPTKPGEGRGRPLPHVRPPGLFGPLAPGLKTGYPG
jgi:hypothetical protein